MVGKLKKTFETGISYCLFRDISIFGLPYEIFSFDPLVTISILKMRNT